KYSSNGTKQWSKQFGTAQYDQAADAVIDNNTLYIIGSTKGTMSGASKTSASATDNDSFITRLDLNGNILGSDQFGELAVMPHDDNVVPGDVRHFGQVSHDGHDRIVCERRVVSS
ncbi:MAG: hypothetical protein EB075_14475, partial [Bacteroidetes bacterium]|nr:hypothetical protein [Bacteroidota bacterium]